MNVLGISGSLRRASYNTMALHAAQKLAPQGMRIELADISGIPLYNDDVRLAGYPQPVLDFVKKVRAADAVLIVTPEYNFSIPGVLKNTLDWSSRPPETPFDGKPVAIMGASPGQVGTARVQYHLRQVFLFLNAQAVIKPEVFINHCASKFNAEGELIDAPTAKVIGELLEALQKLKQRLG
jgi:chromate reductase, NAD(P)H dehydrogenase (quinone)